MFNFHTDTARVIGGFVVCLLMCHCMSEQHQKNGWAVERSFEWGKIQYNRNIVIDSLNSEFSIELSNSSDTDLFILGENILTNNIEVIKIVVRDSCLNPDKLDSEMMVRYLNKYIQMSRNNKFYTVSNSDFILLKKNHSHVINENWKILAKLLGAGQYLVKYKYLAINSLEERLKFHKPVTGTEYVLPDISYPEHGYFALDGEFVLDSINVTIK